MNSPFRLRLLASLCACTFSAPFIAPAGQPAKPALESLNFPYTRQLPYRLYSPAAITPGQTYPLIVFLHGAGERGMDNNAQIRASVPDIIRLGSEKTPFFLVAPQCPPGLRWVEVNWGADSHEMPAQPSEPLTVTMDLVAKLCKELPIDPKRLYIVGLSMGGFGVWDAISRYPGKFAAAVPVCGGGDLAQAPKLVNTPIWAFHGDQDNTVKTHRSVDMVAAVKTAGGDPKYTELPGVGHGAWGPAFQTPELYDWLFAQTLK